MANLLPEGKQSFTNSAGAPLVGGKVYTYDAGTTNPRTTYQDAAGTVPNANPVILDARGEAVIYWSGTYKVVLKDALDNTIYTVDNYKGVDSQLASRTGSDLVGTPNPWGAQYLKTVSDIHNGQEVEIDRFLPTSHISAIRNGTSTYDCGTDLSSAFADFTNGGGVYAKYGLYIVETGDIDILNNFSLRGDGMRATRFRFKKTVNPATSEFMFAARLKYNIVMRDLTLESNAYDDGLFNVGTYTAGPPKKYANGDAGNINGLVISSCTNVLMRDVEVRYFNYHGVRVSVEGSDPALHYNQMLTFDRMYGHHCVVAPLDMLGVQDAKVINGTFTDNGNFTASYIDGSVGYGVSLARTPSANQLRSFNVLCANNFTARNARHGIDVHAGANIAILNNRSVDNLLMGVCVLDYAGSADDSYVGDVIVRGNHIFDTSWKESKLPLITYRDDGSERDDSNAIFITNNGSLLRRAFVEHNIIRDMRHRQLVANTTSDLAGCIYAAANQLVRVAGNSVHNTITGYFPSSLIEVSSPVFEVEGNTVQSSQRSTVSKPAFLWSASGGSGKGKINGNHLDLYGVYSDSAGTQAAYPMMRKSAGTLDATGNTFVMPPQGVRGGLWYDTGTNVKWGFNGILNVNEGNTLYPDGVTAVEYSSRIKGALTIYLSQAGSGRFDGFSSGNRFTASNPANFAAIINDMPYCANGLTVMIDTDQLDWGAAAGATIPDWQDNITFRGVTTETANSMTKTGGIKTTGNNLITCPTKSQNINFENLYVKSGGAYVLKDYANFTYGAVEGLSNGMIGLYGEYKSSYVRSTRFQGPGAGTSVAIGAFLGARVVSQLNDDGATKFAYGLNANSGAIYKNSTQPTGATANELPQNGGTIA
jgi:hypothetical protein